MTLSRFHEVAGGYDRVASMVQKFGYNAAVTTAEDIWESGGVYTGFLAAEAEDTVNVVSGDDSDNGATATGALTLRLIGLDAAGVPITEDVTLNGTTPVAGVKVFSRLQRAYVLTAGSNGTNAGVITIDTDTANTVLATISAGTGQTLIAAYTVPSTKSGQIIRWNAGVSKAAGVAASAVLALQTKESGGAWRTRFTQALNGGSDFEKEISVTVPALTDIRVRALSVSSEVLVSAEFDVVEVDANG
jgi:hypothetical protein